MPIELTPGASSPTPVAAIPSTQSSDMPFTDSQKIQILAVEDNPDTLRLLQYMLASKYETKFSAQVDEALHLASESPYHLFLLDINLGEDRTGIDLLGLLRECSPNATTPAIALTAYAMPGDKDRFIQAGFDGYLSKPFTRSALYAAIESAVSGRSESE